MSGQWTAVVSTDGSLRDVSFNGIRVFDAIALATRDVRWSTASAGIDTLMTRLTMTGFEVSFRLRHRIRGNVDVRWSGTIVANGPRMVFDVQAVALRDQRLNRAGLLLLHPLEARGTRLGASTLASEIDRVFPDAIEPTPLLTEIRELTLEPAVGTTIDVTFEGDVFETEDHRNWTDAGWKTYSTPLSYPAPTLRRRGDRWNQRIQLTARSTGRNPSSTEPVVRTGALTDRTVPLIGATVPRRRVRLSEAPRLGLSYLHARLGDRGVPLDVAIRTARTLGLPLRVAIVAREGELSEWSRQLDRAGCVPESVSVFAPASGDTPQTLLKRAMSLWPGRVGGGSVRNFAELNRLSHPVVGGDFVEFAVSPQVHHDDDPRILDTVRGLRDAIRDARRIAGGRPLHVGPVTLSPEAGAADRRQHSELVAAYALGVVATAAEEGASSLTLFSVAGRDGVLRPRGSSPVAAVIMALAARSGGRVRSLRNSDPRRVTALGLESETWIANLTATALQVQIDREPVDLAPYEVAVHRSNKPVSSK